jgi:HAD superfamily hydrolase (TIGR01484 family)
LAEVCEKILDIPARAHLRTDRKPTVIPLRQIPADQAAAVHTLITDVDDTLTTDGRLTAAAYSALEQLQQAGLRIVVTTGRPAGWCDHIARMWPVDAVVGENGAVCFWYDSDRRKVRMRQVLPAAQVVAHLARTQTIGQQVLAAVPGAALASDQFCRLHDLAIDYCEDVPRLGEAEVATIVRLLEEAGMTVKVSSIHVNAWFGTHDKLSATRDVLRDLWGLDVDQDRARFAYAGDSPNDAPMFAHFPVSVGVANVRDFVGKMDALPRYVTQGRSGQGFVELALQLLSARTV